jgi:hypothetical protein
MVEFVPTLCEEAKRARKEYVQIRSLLACAMPLHLYQPFLETETLRKNKLTGVNSLREELSD